MKLLAEEIAKKHEPYKDSSDDSILEDTWWDD